MKLSRLLAILSEPSVEEREISGITANLDEVQSGFLFVAIPGTRTDGHTFLNSAKARGAFFLIGERPAQEFGLNEKDYLQVPDSRLALGLLASAWEGHPSREMRVIGITGTSGKTTTSFLVESVLRAAGMKPGLIGTVAFRIDGKEIPSTHTTPGPVELQHLLREMRNAGCDSVVLEVSSHALKQHRGVGIAYDAVGFTNLSPEHLDYHFDLEDYFASKRILFREQADRSRNWGKEPKLLVHSGNSAGDRLLAELSHASPFSVEASVKIDAEGVRGIFSGVQIHSSLIGRFNAENIAAAVALTKSIGIPDAAITNGIQALDRVPGRLERVSDPAHGRIVLVDYAHKPDALEKVLSVLRPMRAPGNRLFTVIGCGGDRDRTKRTVMGEIACRLSDRVIFTSDNPRTENPEHILDEILSGCAASTNWVRESDRRKAIALALKEAKTGDLVLIAGKGHENYQIVGTTKTPFDDAAEARSAMAAMY